MDSIRHLWLHARRKTTGTGIYTLSQSSMIFWIKIPLPDRMSLYTIAHTQSHLVLRELQRKAELNFTASIRGEEVLTSFVTNLTRNDDCKFPSGLILNVLFTDLPIAVGYSWQDFDSYFTVTLTNTYYTPGFSCSFLCFCHRLRLGHLQDE